jgi:hypothetical protein
MVGASSGSRAVMSMSPPADGRNGSAASSEGAGWISREERVDGRELRRRQAMRLFLVEPHSPIEYSAPLEDGMDGEAKLFARMMFRLRVHEAKGLAYQRLFEKVMRYSESGFTPVQPYGSFGDRKNDGYCPSSGTYYQVYAPDDPERSRSIATAATKTQEDFEGLRAYWHDLCQVRSYRFVFNDHYRGSPVPVETALLEIATQHNVDAASLLASHLEDRALALADDQILDILQTTIPRTDIMRMTDFGVLREVVIHILQYPIPISEESVLSAPDFGEKLRFNGLSPEVGKLLTVASYQSEVVTDYFSKNSTFAKQNLRNHLASMYAEARKVNAEDDPHLGDLVFFHLLGSLTPAVPAERAGDVQRAALVVIAFFFEACDVFEDPHAST